MSMSICFHCGEQKSRALDTCPACGKIPQTRGEQVRSAALSPILSAPAELAQYQAEIIAGRTPSIPAEIYRRAVAALRDPGALALLRSRPLGAVPVGGANAREAPPPAPILVRRWGEPAGAVAPVPEPAAPPVAQLGVLALHESPFAILNASVHDGAARLRELAEQCTRAADKDSCAQAAADLTDPHRRLHFELGWLPAISPSRAARLLQRLGKDPMALRREQRMPTLAHLNLLAAALGSVERGHPADDLIEFILAFANLAQGVNAQLVLTQINRDRAVANFPQLGALVQIDAGLAVRQRHWRAAVRAALDRQASASVLRVMAETVDRATAGGRKPAPALVDALVDDYEAAIRSVLQVEAGNIARLIHDTQRAAAAHEPTEPFIAAIDIVTRNWNELAWPIQLDARARGTDHEASRQLARHIRGLATTLFNQHGLLEQALRIVDLLREQFAAVPAVVERATRDAGALAELSAETPRAARR